MRRRSDYWFLMKCGSCIGSRLASTFQRKSTPWLVTQIFGNSAPLLESCAIDAGAVTLSSMIGVGVVALVRGGRGGEPALTLWVDPSFAHYFWTTLLEVGGDLGAVAVNESGGTEAWVSAPSHALQQRG